MRHAVVEWVRICIRVLADESSLTRICQEKARVGITEPADLDCAATESSNIREEGFNTSERQENTSETSPPFVFVPREIIESVVRVEGFENSIIVSENYEWRPMQNVGITYRARLNIPKPALNANQRITIGEKAMVSLEIPRGWRMKRKTRIAHVTPTIVGLDISGLTTLRPCTAPRTDWAGVRTPSAMTMETAKTPIIFNNRRKNFVSSIVERRVFCDRLSLFVS